MGPRENRLRVARDLAVPGLGRNAGNAKQALMAVCKHGHPYDEANTYVTKKGVRQCRRCNAEQARRKRRERREANG